MLFIIGLAFAGSALVNLLTGPPTPWVHDEFSRLLGADTFASGRLANAPHPLPAHFETVHVIQKPTYASKYQPAPALVLAIGQRIGGHPVVGVWLASTIMSALVFWMLRGWLRPRWAFLGGVLTVLQFGVAGVWAQSYWGGAVAAAGGALVMGAVPRILRFGRTGDGVALGLGMVVLAASRPFEGLVVSAAACGLLTYRMRGRGMQRSWPLALASTLAIGALTLGFYNRAVTGNALKLPYTEHWEQYDAAPLFVFQNAPEEKVYTNERLRRFHSEWEKRFYDEQQTFTGWFRWALGRPAIAIMSYGFGPPREFERKSLWLPGLTLLPFLVLSPLLRRARSRFAFGTCTVLFVVLTLATYFMPTYVAPLSALWMLLVVDAIRLLRVACRRKAVLRWLVPSLLAYSVFHVGLAIQRQRAIAVGIAAWSHERSRIERDLSAAGSKHLILVSYSDDYGHAEWVYNAADLAEHPVVWAHDLGRDENEALLRHYFDRTVWYLHVAPGDYQIESAPRPHVSGDQILPESPT